MLKLRSGCREMLRRASRMNCRGAFLLAAVGLGGVLVSPGPALADFRVCNSTQNLVGVAIGYRTASGWVSEGWWHIEKSSCKTLIEGSLESRFYYIYAEDAQSGGRWEGETQMCIALTEFKIAGTNDCFARGFQRAGFQEYDTREQENWMVDLTDGPADGRTITGTNAGTNGGAQ
nr:DUF1036 domain-containing protein [Nitratireductor pacificus]